jgi:hypothetical protein
MRVKDKLHPRHPNYNDTTTHYVIRLGSVEHWDFNMPYPMPTDCKDQTPESAVRAFTRMVEMCSGEDSDKTRVLKLVLVKRLAGTVRATGRMRFYEKEVMTWTSRPLH